MVVGSNPISFDMLFFNKTFLPKNCTLQGNLESLSKIVAKCGFRVLVETPVFTAFNLNWQGFFNVNNLYFYYWEEQFSYVFLFTFISFFLTFFFFLLAFILSKKDLSYEKLSPYECGFEPFEDGFSIFNIQFFIIGITFLIFDLELAYLFPWVVYLGSLNTFSFFIMFFFFFFLILGFIYE
jgi:NADH-quinone oxidoreductase subunit A